MPMVQWKNILRNSSVVTYEATTPHAKARIECRKNDDGTWQIYKTHYTNTLHHTEEFFASNQEELNLLLKSLMQQKVYSFQELAKIKREQHRIPRIHLKRAFKEDGIEKWWFSIDQGPYENFFIIRETEVLEIDIIMHEQHQSYEQAIVSQMKKILSIDSPDLETEEHIYYFTRKKTILKEPSSQFPLFESLLSDE
ncbi:MAG: hypothetical protein QW594_03465 [Candidatus Woesearchaeota archaeon]